MTPPFKAMSFERVVCKFVTAQGDPLLGPAHPDLSYTLRISSGLSALPSILDLRTAEAALH